MKGTYKGFDTMLNGVIIFTFFIMIPLILILLMLLFIEPENLFQDGVKLWHGPGKNGVKRKI